MVGCGWYINWEYLTCKLLEGNCGTHRAAGCAEIYSFGPNFGEDARKSPRGKPICGRSILICLWVETYETWGDLLLLISLSISLSIYLSNLSTSLPHSLSISLYLTLSLHLSPISLSLPPLALSLSLSLCLSLSFVLPLCALGVSRWACGRWQRRHPQLLGFQLLAAWMRRDPLTSDDCDTIRWSWKFSETCIGESPHVI